LKERDVRVDPGAKVALTWALNKEDGRA